MTPEERLDRELMTGVLDESLDLFTLGLHMISHGYNCLYQDDSIALFTNPYILFDGGIIARIEGRDLQVGLATYEKANVNTSDGVEERVLSVYDIDASRGLMIDGSFSNMAMIALTRYFALSADAERSYDEKNYENVKARYIEKRNKLKNIILGISD